MLIDPYRLAPIVPVINLTNHTLVSPLAVAHGSFGGSHSMNINFRGSGTLRVSLSADSSVGNWTFDGVGGKLINTSVDVTDEWVTAATAGSLTTPSDYQIKMTTVSGTAPGSGTVGSYISMSSGTGPQWIVSRPGTGAAISGVWLFEIQAAANPGVVLDSSSFTWSFTNPFG